ncbi:hypothetical protein [Amycolatopsis sp. H20-H5]|uniref:hypothetical protein n=1 Tax=Amycolatopsis sp. H20-H5 TaxID=3046309 RepID=UPI002DBA392F|nr:hypothetical protein [Amycolatopsis sp. H20-H5]MEC3977280.1 hypothetical protein [Amycolatopsis sp. H20-H5]
MPLRLANRTKGRRWALVSAVAAVLVAVPLVVAALPAGASADPGRLRALIAASARQPYQGYAESRGSLGLPDLPKLADVTKLFTGTTQLRAWYSSPDSYRVDVLTTSGERDLTRTADSEYSWDYGANTLTQFLGEPPVRLPRAADLLPPELARRLLAAAPGDRVDALPARRVAGVEAAGIRLTPADPDTTVGRIDVWADPGTGVAVQVELTAKGQTAPVLTTSFEELAQTQPDVLAEPPRPAPGSGFAVAKAPDVTAALGALGRAPLPSSLAGKPLRTTALGGVQGAGLYGTGLASFVVLAIPRDLANGASDAAAKGGARSVQLPGGTAVALAIPPLSLMVVNSTVSRRSYLLAGLVTPASLETAGRALAVLRRGGGR